MSRDLSGFCSPLNLGLGETRSREDSKMAALSRDELAFWEENGYVVLKGAVPAEYARAAEDAVWAFVDMDRDDPETWYPDPPRPGIMVEMYQHQALWDNRQAPRVHEAFSQIWGTEKLWVSFDRASLNPPERPGFEFKGPYLHWDMSLENPTGLKVQGVLYLADTAANQGAFTCIPRFHKKLESWLAGLPEEVNPRERVKEEFADEATPIPAKVGDLVIWHSALPHGSGPNSASYPRVVQYITMTPSPKDNEAARESRIKGWRERLTGLGKNEKEKEHAEGETAKLTELGKKLLGLERW